MSDGISITGIGSRFVFAFLLVCFTWNPTRYNYVEWAIAQWENLMPVVVFVGLVLLAGWVYYLRVTARALGVLGIVLSLALCGTAIWILFYYNVVSTQSTTLISWLALILFSFILAMGMSWSHLSRSWSGQVEVDDKDN